MKPENTVAAMNLVFDSLHTPIKMKCFNFGLMHIQQKLVTGPGNIIAATKRLFHFINMQMKKLFHFLLKPFKSLYFKVMLLKK